MTTFTATTAQHTAASLAIRMKAARMMTAHYEAQGNWGIGCPSALNGMTTSQVLDWISAWV